MSQHEATLELFDGRVICTYDSRTGEIIEIFNWHGGNVGHRMWLIAQEAVNEAMADAAEARAEAAREAV